MASFTKKVLGLATVATAFAGMAFGQAICSAPPTSTSNIIRAEGTAEQVAQLNFVCSSPAALPGGGAATVQLFVSPSLPITSKLLNSTNGATEATLTVNGTSVQGSVSGSTITFVFNPAGGGTALPAAVACLPAGSFCYNFTVSNVRVNAKDLQVTSGVPPQVSETIFISGSAANITPAALASTPVAFAQYGLASSSIFNRFTPTAAGSFPSGAGSGSGTRNYVICNALSPRIDNINIATTGAVLGQSAAFVVRVAEAFTQAFKQVGAGPNTGEQSQVARTIGTTTNGVNTGTRFQVNFANIPTGVTLYVPNGVMTSTNGSSAQAQLTAAGPGAPFGGAVTGSSSTNITGTSGQTGLTAAAGLVAVTTSNGAGNAVFEILLEDFNGLDRFDIPVFVVTSANSVPGSATAITANVSFNPIGVPTAIPNFIVGPNTNTLTGSRFDICSTSLLFPFVTNQLGFDTGIAISNTSTDPFGNNGATAQAGTCNLNFYGSGAPSPTFITTPSVASGTVYTQVLSGVAAGFQGYMIAQCNFQFAHGFAFVTNGVGATGGLSQGYLAGVIPDVNQKGRAADPLSAAAAGTGETLGN